MATNERKFRRAFSRHFGPDALGEKIKWPTGATRDEVSITADACVPIEDKTVLVEIDSGNAAKLLIGQYVLLSDFCETNREKTLFLVVHYYKNYDTNRTIKNFQYIAQHILGHKALMFVVLGKNEFWQICRNVNTVHSLWRELTRRSTGR